MRKRILIAEAGNTVRQAAETVLRKNGYEVISVPSADKAREVLSFARPDLVLVGGTLQTSDQKLYFERLQSEPKTSDIPMLVIEPSDKRALDWPGELMIHQPVDPKELLDKTASHLAQKAARVQPLAHKEEQETPQAGQAHIDDFLDEALGLDKLDVTDSEVMGNSTTNIRRPPKPMKDATIGLESVEEEELSDSSRVESLIIREDSTDIRHKTGPQKPAASPASAGSLEIMKDQYGLTDPSAFKQSQRDETNADHDYNWFVKSIRDENNPSKAAGAQSDSSKIAVTNTSSLVDPVTPGPGGAAPSSKRTEGVDKFIDEFKKEIEQLRSSDVEPLPSGVTREPVSPAKSLSWEDKLETVSAEQVGLFTRELARELADRIADRLVAKIDSDKLLQMLKEEIVARARKK